jgi:hypothetical protein
METKNSTPQMSLNMYWFPSETLLIQGKDILDNIEDAAVPGVLKTSHRIRTCNVISTVLVHITHLKCSKYF